MSTTYPTTRTAYKNILDKTFILPTNENKVLNYGFTKENIHDVYLLPFLVTDETKLIAFQHKIIHNILPCRSSLFRAGLVDDDICSLCKLEKQSLVHMLYNCSESLLFWERFTQWWQEKFPETIDLSVNAVLFGWHQNASNKRVLNYLLIIAKYYIFTTSVCNNKLSFDCFFLRLNSKFDVLRTIAIKNKSLNKTKLIAFQYKIIDNILPRRSSLFRAGLVDDDICSLCKLEKQSLVHMLYNCSESLLFWEKFTQWWQGKFSETIALSVNAILFGWHQNASNKSVLNYILIIVEIYYIFTTSVCNNKLSFDCFLLRLNSKLDVLRMIAIKNKSLNKFETTWAPLS